MIGIERRFSDDTRLIDLTVRDLKELITSLISKIKQIEEKRYDEEILALGIEKERIRHYGFAFEGKKVLIG